MNKLEVTDFAQTPPVSVPRTSNARSNPRVFLFPVIKPTQDGLAIAMESGKCPARARLWPNGRSSNRGFRPIQKMATIHARSAVIQGIPAQREELLLRDAVPKPICSLACVDPHEPWTWKGACASAGRNDPPANATPRRTICPTIDRERRRHFQFLLR
jgi:hypothetical protein